MSLDTVLKIGKLYRKAPNYWDYHSLINPIIKDVEANAKKKDKDGNVITTIFYEVPVTFNDKELTIHVDNVKEISDEDKKKSLYYLNFKTSQKESTKKYMFGDIYYMQYFDKKKGEVQGGNYKWVDIIDKNKNKLYQGSFLRCKELAKPLEKTFIGQFRKDFEKKLTEIENLLLSNSSVVIHFDFSGNDWFIFPDYIDMIDRLIIENITSKFSDDLVMLNKYLYKSIGGQNVPNFNTKNNYKVKSFTNDEIVYLLYALKAAQAEKMTLHKTEIGIVILPNIDENTEGLTAQMVSKFLPKVIDLEEEEKEERSFNNENERILLDDDDDLLADFIYNSFSEKVKFDLVFTSIPKSKATGVYRDLIEISSVEKSFIVFLNEKIKNIKKSLKINYSIEFPKKEELKLDIQISYNRIIANSKTKVIDKKYQFHLLKVLPLIFTDTYYQDPVLLPLFIGKIEHNIRNEGQEFNTLKYDFYFLTQIQKFNPLMAITASKSYQIGKCLGIMAKQFEAWRDDCPIKSFEKSYVGNLSRRITSLEDMTKFSNFINEKLTMHERWHSDVKEAYSKFVSLLTELEQCKGEYNKNHCALGFFESYFKTFEKSNS